jgi:hypothetical protein
MKIIDKAAAAIREALEVAAALRGGTCKAVKGGLTEVNATFDSRVAARNALLEIRAPSSAMQDAGMEVDHRLRDLGIEPADIWQAMIDAALAEKA